MKCLIICGISFLIASGGAYAQDCPTVDSIFFNSSTLPGGVLPTGDTSAFFFVVGSGSSGYITTAPNTTTALVAYYDDPYPDNAAIVFNQNFQTNIGTSGVFSASINVCGIEEVSTRNSLLTNMSVPTASPGLVVYPTVNKGSVTVTGSAASLAKANIIVFDATGRTVYSLYNEAGTTLYLALGNLADGLYFLQIRQASKVTTQKIIIMK